MRRPTRADMLGARWANRALREARAKLATGELKGITIAPPRDVPASGVRGVRAVLRLRRHSCLEGALIRQSWAASHGDRRDVVIGVRRPSEGFGAHAWLEGERDGEISGMREITRLPI